MLVTVSRKPRSIGVRWWLSAGVKLYSVPARQKPRTRAVIDIRSAAVGARTAEPETLPARPCSAPQPEAINKTPAQIRPT